MKYRLGHRVLIARAADNTCDRVRLAQEGIILRVMTARKQGSGGQSSEDPLYLVEFGDGQCNSFWGEELELVRLFATT